MDNAWMDGLRAALTLLALALNDLRNLIALWGLL